jgi:beta-aspartyl-peptidase (threonine type)
MLEASADAWNRGDLEAFLSNYQDAPSTTFVGSQGVLSGLQQIREHYAPEFEPGSQRDSLRFESLRVRSLSPMIGLVTARWVLYDDGITQSAGPFTLILRRTGNGWKIIHDHSSSDPAPAGF